QVFHGNTAQQLAVAVKDMHMPRRVIAYPPLENVAAAPNSPHIFSSSLPPALPRNPQSFQRGIRNAECGTKASHSIQFFVAASSSSKYTISLICTRTQRSI